MADRTSSPGQRGAVRNPQTDGRLKHNRASGMKQSSDRSNVQHGGQGRVKNPDTDRRLKINR